MRACERKLGLERHRYAPELNTLAIGSTRLRVPGQVTIQGATEYLGWTRAKPTRMVEVRVEYPPAWSNLSRVHRGWVHNYHHAQVVVQKLRQYHCGGDRTLLDGRVLPIPEIHVRTWLEG